MDCDLWAVGGRARCFIRQGQRLDVQLALLDAL
jgi:hypothetical protein